MQNRTGQERSSLYMIPQLKDQETSCSNCAYLHVHCTQALTLSSKEKAQIISEGNEYQTFLPVSQTTEFMTSSEGKNADLQLLPQKLNNGNFFSFCLYLILYRFRPQDNIQDKPKAPSANAEYKFNMQIVILEAKW